MKEKTYEEKIKERRARYDKSYKNSPHSPLLEKQKEKFEKMEYFPINKEYKIIAKFTENINPDKIMIPATKGDIREYYRYGVAEFEIDGKKCKLTVFKPAIGNYEYLPFKDKTTGIDSYKGGRYVDPKQISETEMIIDFNTAYNPYCAYNDRYSCAMVPDENILNVTISAGQKKFDNYQPM